MPRDDDDSLLRDLEDTLGETALYLGVFPETEVRRALKKYGVESALAKKGIAPWTLTLHLEDPFAHRLVISVPHEGEQAAVVDTTVKRTRRSLPLAPELGPFEALEIQWLELSNPQISFSTARPPLPGQRFPGLGLAREALALQQAIARRLRLEALVTTPRWLHNAVLYLRAGYRAMDPDGAARLAALLEETRGLPLAEASARIDSREPPFVFAEMCLPLSARLKALEARDPALPLGWRAR